MATACAVAAAVVWLLVWLHQYRSHGRTTVNEMRLVLGLTWMDAAKILPFAYLLLLPGLELLVARTTTRASRVVARFAQACLVVAAVAGAVDFWTFPTGSYAVTFESRGNDGVPVQFLGSVLAGLALVTWAVLRRRARTSSGHCSSCSPPVPWSRRSGHPCSSGRLCRGSASVAGCG